MTGSAVDGVVVDGAVVGDAVGASVGVGNCSVLVDPIPDVALGSATEEDAEAELEQSIALPPSSPATAEDEKFTDMTPAATRGGLGENPLTL
jgi:hypothetical protein